MRVRCIDGKYVIAVEYAECDGKALVFRDYNGKYYHTDDYYHENTALCTLSDLAKNGYILVERLHIKEDFKG